MPRIKPRKTINYNYTFPLGLGYISSVMKLAGYEVSCLNLNHSNGSVENIFEKISRTRKFDIVATGSVWFGYIMIEEIVKATRKYYPKAKVIIGGSIVTSAPEIIMKYLKPDFGIIGEGEITILELLIHLTILSRISLEMIQILCMLRISWHIGLRTNHRLLVRYRT